MNTKVLALGVAAACGMAFPAGACTGIALTAKDGSYIQARTIEWAKGYLESGYTIIPRGEKLFSYTPDGGQGCLLNLINCGKLAEHPLVQLHIGNRYIPACRIKFGI